MIGSTSENNSQSYVSGSLSLSANSYYKLSFYVFADYDKLNEKDNLGASVSLKTESKTLYDYYNIHFSDNNWHQFVLYLKTGVNSETATLSLNFDGLTGYVYFDDIKLETSNETVFNNFTKEPEITYTKVDLSYENFDNRTFNKFETLQTPNNWTGKEQDDSSVTNSGILDISDEIISPVSETLSGNAKALYIQSLHNVNYAYTSNSSYTFNAQTYYKISVNVLTKDILAENNPDGENYGASIYLNDSQDIVLKGINTLGGWRTYTIYLNLQDSLSSKVSLGLGYKDEKVSGKVLFDNLKIETIEKSQFEEELKTCDDNLVKCFINYTETTDDKEDESTWSNEFNWLILPSLITAIAIIVAVIGFYVRKINFNRKPKIKTKYDRRKTLDKDIDRREKIALRQQIIEELNAELSSIDEEIAEYNKLAEAQLEELKNKILAEKEEIKRQKLDLEIKKKEATAEREKELKANPELVSNKKAETEFVRLMEKLDKQEMHLQKQLNLKDLKLEQTKEADKSKLAKYLERKEFIKNEIAKIEAEIEEIAREEAEMWEEYKKAKLQAKQRKAEYKAQQKSEKEAKKLATKQQSKENTSPTSKKSVSSQKTKDSKTKDKKSKTLSKTDKKDFQKTTEVKNENQDNSSEQN